jgi:phospholipid/cholesterol/gamma-HCH transport system substrate-binding protein
MDSEISNRIKLGIFVTLGTVIFIVSVYLLGRQQSLFGNTFYIRCKFRNVNGLQLGNNVRLSGINIGTVKKLEIISDTSIVVYMTIEENNRSFIKTSSIAIIGSDGLVGEKIVNIIPGKYSGRIVEDNDEISSHSPISPEDLNRMANLAENDLTSVSSDLTDFIHKATHERNAARLLFEDSIFALRMSEILFALQTTVHNSAFVTSDLRDIVYKMKNGEGNVGIFLKDTVLYDDLEGSISNIKAVSDTSMVIARNLHTIITDLNTPLGVLLYDPNTADDFRVIATNIKEGSIKLNENMTALRQNFLLRRYFKNKEKKENSKK